MKRSLKTYQQKRDFKRTKEPDGKTAPVKNAESSQSKRKFIVQHHLARRDHYDFRLEWKGVLLSWAVPKGPSFNPKDKRLAVHVEDHPVDYASFEGTIPKGQYGGGTVMLWDDGFWEPIGDVDQGLENGSLKMLLFGQRLQGQWALVRLQAKEGEKQENWLLIKDKDEFSQTKTGISGFTTSVKTGRTMQEIASQAEIKVQTNPFSEVSVQLPTLVDVVPKGKDWLYEVKYDGYRMLAFIEKRIARLITRNGHDYSNKLREVTAALENWANQRAMVLDGEIVVTDVNGKSDFQLLQNYLKHPYDKALTYIVFDLLALDGEDLRQQPLLQRKEKLAALLADAPPTLSFSKHVIGKGKQCFDAAQKLDLEGIVGKRADSLYLGERNLDWVKLKCYHRQEFVIGGYTLSDKKTSGISALLLGAYQDQQLIYIGRAGTGFTLKQGQTLVQQFANALQDKPSFTNPPKAKKEEQYFWLKPKFVAEVQFAELTADNLLRQASFKGLRMDKSPKEIVFEIAKKEGEIDIVEEKAKKGLKKTNRTTKANLENITVCGVEISNPNKIVYQKAKLKKIDVIQYYQQVAKRMLAYAGERILSVVRCHKGVTGDCFFKKHPATGGEGVVAFPITNTEGKTDTYFYIKDQRGLVYQAQLGTIEFHVWGSRVNTLDQPDMMVFDLDPDVGMGIKQIRQGVKDLKKVLDALHLKSFLKTSGGKGYHVVVPFTPSVNWDTFYSFSKQVAQLMVSKWPERYTSNVRKQNRKGKIFIDWGRNGRGATSVAAYSLRARPGAPVSMPIAWSELDKISPNEIDMATALTRIKKADPWKKFYQVDQQLTNHEPSES